jgi:hypothetical protein
MIPARAGAKAPVQTEATRRERRAADFSHAISRSSRAASRTPMPPATMSVSLERSVRDEAETARGMDAGAVRRDELDLVGAALRSPVREREHFRGSGDIQRLDVGEDEDDDPPVFAHGAIMMPRRPGRNARYRTISAIAAADAGVPATTRVPHRAQSARRAVSGPVGSERGC